MRRIIPAYAGSTCAASRWCSRRRDHPRIRGEHSRRSPARRIRSLDHPRIRGEHANQVAKTKFGRGSSPHTRGAPCSPSTPSTTRGIIPAYAGSTYDFDVWCWNSWDHPRIRGEHSTSKASRRFSTGIIPAYAGSTRCRRRPRGRCRDHPRIRGEHLNRIKQELPSEGSSPHTRGAREL